MKKHQRQRFATIAGSLTTLFLAVEFVDFDKLDWSSINTYVKLAVLLLPAIGGIFSEVSEPKKNV